MKYKIQNIKELKKGLTLLLLDKKVRVYNEQKIIIDEKHTATFHLQFNEYMITVENFSDFKLGMTIEFV